MREKMGGVVKILIMRPAHFCPGVILAKFHPAATKKAENVALDQIFVAAKKVYL